MSDAVLIAAITVLGGGVFGVWVELIRNRKRQETVVREVSPNGGASMKDALARLEQDTRAMREQLGRNSERLAALEAVVIERSGGRNGRR